MTKNGLDGFMYNILWSPHRIGVAECLRRYGFTYGPDKLPTKTTLEMGFGSVLHRRLENFRFPMNYRVKKRRGTPKIEDAEEFARKTANIWKNTILRNEQGLSKHPMVYEDSSHAYATVEIMYELAKKIHPILVGEGQPLEVEFKLPKLTIGGIRFWGIIDKIPGLLSFVDYKTRKYKVPISALEHDRQMTMYAASLSILSAKNRSFAERYAKITEEEWQLLQKDPLWLYDNPRVKYGQWWFETAPKLGLDDTDFLNANIVNLLKFIGNERTTEEEIVRKFIAKDRIENAPGKFKQAEEKFLGSFSIDQFDLNEITIKEWIKWLRMRNLIHKMNENGLEILVSDKERRVEFVEAPTRTRDQLMKLVLHVDDLQDRIATGYLPPKESKECDFCDFREECSRYNLTGKDMVYNQQQDLFEERRKVRIKNLTPENLTVELINKAKKEKSKPEGKQLEMFG